MLNSGEMAAEFFRQWIYEEDPEWNGEFAPFNNSADYLRSLLTRGYMRMRIYSEEMMKMPPDREGILERRRNGTLPFDIEFNLRWSAFKEKHGFPKRFP